MRQIVLDTETTGLDHAQGHRVIEIGCFELIDRQATGNNKQWYINPERSIDKRALEVHGITAESLQNKKIFEQIQDEFIDYIKNSQLVIHNAPFDIGFLNNEFTLLGLDINMASICQHEIIDTLVMARKKHPGQRNNLDALCKRYTVKNKHRSLHGAVLDAEILAQIYLKMTGGQIGFSIQEEKEHKDRAFTYKKFENADLVATQVTQEQRSEHENYIKEIKNSLYNEGN